MDLTWTVEFDAAAHSDLLELDRSIQARMVQFLRTRVAGPDSPRRFGKPLKGEHSGMWRYRVGDYRLICLLEDDRQTVVVVAIGHRRDVYR